MTDAPRPPPPPGSQPEQPPEPPPAGWYPAPGAPPGTVRYWDGRQWTSQTASGSDQPQPIKAGSSRTTIYVVSVIAVTLIVLGALFAWTFTSIFSGFDEFFDGAKVFDDLEPSSPPSEETSGTSR